MDHKKITEQQKENRDADKLASKLSATHIGEAAASSMTHQESAYISELKSKLDELHCHFTWKPDQNDPSYSTREPIETMKQKLDNFDGSVPNPVLAISCSSVLAYANALNGEFPATLNALENCLKMLNNSALNSVREGFHYVLVSDLAHVNFLLKNYEIVDKLLASLKPYSALSPKEKATVLVMAGHCCLEFAAKGFVKGKTHFEEALAQDPTNPDCHFLLGKVLARIRRLEAYRDPPTALEFEHLECAVAYGRHPSYRLTLAQTYMDKAHCLFRLYGRVPESHQLNEKAINMFTEVLNANPRCAKTNAACGKAFSVVPYPFKNGHLAKKCFTTAFELAPDDNKVIHALGNFYERQNDFGKAKEIYEKCVAKPAGNYGAEINLLRIKFKDPCYNPVPDLHRILERYQVPGKQLDTYVQMGHYYYLRQGNLESAMQYYAKAIELNRDSASLLISFPVFQKIEMNTYKTLQDILKKLMSQTRDPEKMKSYREILGLVEEFLAGK